MVLRESIAPLMMAQAGLLGLCLVPDFTANKITVISTWRSSRCTLALEAQPYFRHEIVKLDRLLAAEPASHLRSDLPN